MKASFWVIGAAVAAMSAMLIGCSGTSGTSTTTADTGKKGDAQTAKPMSTEPVTIRVNNWNTAFQQAEFDKYFAEPVRKKYPFITLEYVDFTKGTANTLENLTATGNAPDVVFTDHPNLAGLLEYDFPLDLSAYMGKLAVDLKRVDAQVLDGGRAIAKSGELLALPVYSDRMMWFYNKDLFDKFGLPYPTDTVTWDEAITLFKRLSRTDGGIQYSAFRTINLLMTGSQWGLSLFDPKTDRASFQTDEWKKSLSLLQEINAIPGNTKLTNEDFYQKQTLASVMQSFNIMVNLLDGAEQKGQKINWDVASLPQSKEKPGVAGSNKPLYFMVSKSSKHKEQAIAAIAHLMSSKEVQTLLSENGKMPVLLDKDAQQAFGTKLGILKGRNTAAVYKHKMADLPYTNRFNRVVLLEMIAAGNNVLNGTADMNTALRNAEEKANKAIDEKLKK
ncbi:extracellular solute-binding protein [Paenibacillus mesophilus]|uniref:ABC transporter substrate-binding protein n=1 Tax=Paenibacillus mesophilus TaxID=2582849 RepID=UPI00110EC00C|nr:extracellular solute-binding protein [Paenibacillus mesophilus]TMV52829.1 extracellular solute-binding protein [Paenibacillus mesophilus]